MALTATLEIENKKFDVKELDYEISLPYNNSRKPSAVPQGGDISFTILSPKKNTLLFHNWLLKSSYNALSGKFILPITHNTEYMEKVLIFENAYCVRIHESYSSSNPSQMYMRITITAGIIDFGGGAVFSNNNL